MWPQGYGGPLAASMACGARDRMIRAGLHAPRGERSYDQNWAAPRDGSDGSCPTASPSEIGTRSLGPSRVIGVGTHDSRGGEEVSAHNSSTLPPSSTRDLSLEREPVRGASQPGHKGRIQGPLPTPRRGGGWVPGTDTRSWAVLQSLWAGGVRPPAWRCRRSRPQLRGAPTDLVPLTT